MWNWALGWIQGLWKPVLVIVILLCLPLLGGAAVYFDWWGKLTSSSTEGRIIVHSPSVYTRQRLVNDRLMQSAWLQKQLDVTRDPQTTFRVIDAVRRQVDDSAFA